MERFKITSVIKLWKSSNRTTESGRVDVFMDISGSELAHGDERSCDVIGKVFLSSVFRLQPEQNQLTYKRCSHHLYTCCQSDEVKQVGSEAHLEEGALGCHAQLGPLIELLLVS